MAYEKYSEDLPWNLYILYYHIANLLVKMDEATYENDPFSKTKLINMVLNHVHGRLSQKFPKRIKQMDKDIEEVGAILKMMQGNGHSVEHLRSTMRNQEVIKAMALNKLNIIDRELKDMLTEAEILPSNPNRLPPGEAVRGMFRH